MNKTDLIEITYNKLNGEYSKTDVERFVNAVLDSMKDALEETGKLQLRGFGVFEIRQQDERVVRNPRTGEKLTIPPRKVLKFRVSKNLQDALNA